ncbi:hypothetical protein [Soonwooa sp.]|uniref:FEKKY domain-containing protein n=1 Tax=Soonwooa sp. TaxID=1938592 RepID=UPI0026277689|nr:hypothetical protein [Soonwooa sp.]
MKNALVLISIFSLLNCQEKTSNSNAATPKKVDKEVKEELPTFLIYGEAYPVGYAEEQDSLVTQKFGFKIKRVAGCEISDVLKQSVINNNQKEDKKMEQLFGKNWKEDFTKKSKLELMIPEIE